MKRLLSLLTIMISIGVMAQNQVTGTVTDKSGQPIPGASVVLDGTTGTVTDFDGNFSLNTNQDLPFDLTISSVGLEATTVVVSTRNATLSIQMNETATQLDEIVVSASRMAERIFESPVTVEKFSIQQIESTPSADFFNGMENLKGIQLYQGGLLLNQVATRGFGTVYNEGFVTLVDGMNNMSPLFGFAMGNLIGLNELDVQSVEILPGPASALYGADAYKGMMFMTSKNPFDFEGISAYVKSGVTVQDAAGTNGFNDFGFRLATKLGEKWAIKASFSKKKGTEWAAADYRHNVLGTPDDSYPVNAPDYDGLNIYGERAFTSSSTWGLLGLLNPAAAQLAMFAPNYFDTVVSTGYKDTDLMDSNAENVKTNLAIHFRPDSKTEVSISTIIGTGDSPLQGFGRYAMRNIKIEQHKFQVNRGNFDFKTYYTREQDGDSYQTSAAAALIANHPGSNIADLGPLGRFTGYTGWFANYNLAYLGGLAFASGFTPDLLGVGAFIQNGIGAHIMGGGQSINDLIPGGTGAAHIAARSAANAGMFKVGTDEYDNALASAVSTNLPVVNGGAGIFDDTKTYNYEANYDFSDMIDFADVIVGASYKNTSLNSKGTIYSDQDGPIEYYEYGAYSQVKTKLLDERLNLTGSVRIDKSEFFDTNFTPRVALLYSANKNNNIRVSYQTGFRNPTNQDQYIGLFAGSVTLFGTSPDNISRYNGDVVLANGSPASFRGEYVFNNAVDFNGSPVNLKHVTSEKITSIDLGYRYNSPTFSLDISGYYSDFDDKIGSTDVVIPVEGAEPIANVLASGNYAVYQVDSNANEDLKTYGASVELTQALSRKLFLNVVYDYNKLDYTPSAGSDFEAAFNTPEHKVKAGLTGNYNAFSFSVNARYNSEYLYEASFADEMIDANTVFDAQVTFELPELNAKFRVGGNNIFGNEYVSLVGSGHIGSIYYSALTFDF